MTPVEIYSLRMSLLGAGLTPLPVRDGKAALILQAPPTEAAVRGWSTAYPNAEQTAIEVDGQIIIVSDLAAALAAIAAVKKEPPLTDPKGSPGQRASAFLIEYLAGGPKSSTKVIETAMARGIALITLRRAKHSLGVISEPVKAQSGYKVDSWVWRLPDQTIT